MTFRKVILRDTFLRNTPVFYYVTVKCPRRTPPNDEAEGAAHMARALAACARRDPAPRARRAAPERGFQLEGVHLGGRREQSAAKPGPRKMF